MNDQKSDSTSSDSSIEAIREKISSIDTSLLELLHKRRECSNQVIQVKDSSNVALRDAEREQTLLAGLIQQGKSLGLDAHYITRVFQEVIQDSVRLQREYLQNRANLDDQNLQVRRIAFQGIEGAYSYLAAHKYFARLEDKCSYIGHPTFAEAMKAVEKGQADYAILPIENTTSGGINDVYDLLLHTQLSIVGEEKYQVQHCLLGVEGASLEGIKKIYCHPQTVLQCSSMLADMDVRIEYFSDTALSGKHLKEENDPTVAAIASAEAARIFGLTVLKERIANQQANFTRFLLVARKPITVDPRIPSKTSIVMSTSQEPGALVEALQIFREHNIPLTKLESRPVLDNPWEEMFYIDFEGNLDDERVKRALDEVPKHARFFKILGCYPTQDVAFQDVKPEDIIAQNGDGKSAGSAKGDVVKKKIVNETNKAPAPKKAKGYKLASREYKSEDTIIEVGGVKIGGDNFTVLAGPCSVESYEQIMECARHARDCGAQILRGGCFKPRTSPYSFQGLGWEGLDMMVEAGQKYGLPIITEVLAPEDVMRVAEKADILQIGARNMQNFSLLSEAGRTQRPVMLKRGMSASIEDVLHATEYILAQGNQQVFLCERGIRTFETATRSTLDLSAVPVLKQRTHLPIIVDPSHAAGERWLVPPLAYGSKAVGAHGIIVEFHPKPEEAKSDGPQALLFPQFEEMMGHLIR
jgi:chorismate mutase/prephenate dehydratase